MQEHVRHEHVRQGEHVGHKTCEAREHVRAQCTRACKAQSTEGTRAGKAREPYKLMESNKASHRAKHHVSVLKKFAKFTGKHQSWTLLFYNASDLQPAILFKKRLRHRCFPVSFVNNRTPNDCFDILCDRTYAETTQVFFFFYFGLFDLRIFQNFWFSTVVALH